MEIELEEARRALAPLLDGGRAAVGIERCWGGGISDVYRVRCDPGPDVILKLYPEAFYWKLDKEVHVYGLLRQVSSVPFPEVLWAEKAGARSSRGYLVLERLPGVVLSSVARDLAHADLRRIYGEMGAVLRAVHEVKQEVFGYITTHVPEPHATNLAYMGNQFRRKLEAFRKLGGSAAIARAVEALVEVKRDALSVCAAPVLCHDDLYEGNVLVDGSGPGLRVSGILDVENAVAGDPLLDVAKTLYFSARDAPELREAILEGYGELGWAGPERLRLYSAYHALELWCWFAAQRQHLDALDGIAADLGRFADGNIELGG